MAGHYRWLPTAASNAAFGYNFEGALQEYVLLDERVVVAPNGDSMLIPVPEEFSASALALCEPWACVEDAYVEKQRQKLLLAGKMLVVGEAKVPVAQLDNLFARDGKPKEVTWKTAAEIDGITDAAYDDVVYTGTNAETVSKLFPKVAAHGLLNLVQCGGRFGKPVQSQIGRVHYGGIRLIGTTGWIRPTPWSGYPPRVKSGTATKSTSSALPARWERCTLSATCARGGEPHHLCR